MGFLLLLLVEAAPAELNCRRMPGGCGGKAARRARNRLHAAAATVPSVSMANVSRRVERMLPTTTPAPAAVAKTSQCSPSAVYALVVSGAVSRLCREVKSSVAKASDLLDPSRGAYTPLHVTAASVARHILQPNRNDGSFDVFIHSWNSDLRGELLTHFGSKG